MEYCEPVIDGQTEKHSYILRIINLIKMFCIMVKLWSHFYFLEIYILMKKQTKYKSVVKNLKIRCSKNCKGSKSPQALLNYWYIS